VTQTIPQKAAFLGLAFSTDGRSLYASGGNQDVIYRYMWNEDMASLADSLVLDHPDAKKGGRRYPAGLAPSPDVSGTLSIIPPPTDANLATYSDRVASANGWNVARSAPMYPALEHVIYIIKENRTYDQVFGDLEQGDGDTALVFFPRAISPNHHALAERFGGHAPERRRRARTWRTTIWRWGA